MTRESFVNLTLYGTVLLTQSDISIRTRIVVPLAIVSRKQHIAVFIVPSIVGLIWSPIVKMRNVRAIKPTVRAFYRYIIEANPYAITHKAFGAEVFIHPPVLSKRSQDHQLSPKVLTGDHCVLPRGRSGGHLITATVHVGERFWALHRGGVD